MTRYAFFASLALAACTGDAGDKGTDSGTTPTGPITVQSYEVTCAGDDSTVTFEAVTSGAGYDGLIYEQETASEYMSGGSILQFSDEHDLTSNGTAMSVTIDAGVTYGDQGRNTGTIFSCPNHYETTDDDGSAWMTYAFGAYDEAGAIADCLAGGDDAAGLKAGDYAAYATDAPSAEFDLAICVVATGAR